MEEQDRLRYVSVAVSFGDRESLARLGSGVLTLVCPECGARGHRFGNPGEEHRFEGFTPLSEGGLTSILARCHACQKDVTLPHRRA